MKQSVDHVICNKCNTEQYVALYSDECLNCGYEGYLMDIEQEVSENDEPQILEP